eukprot:1144908-Pelagomonas_calceolata.AAC.9
MDTKNNREACFCKGYSGYAAHTGRVCLLTSEVVNGLTQSHRDAVHMSQFEGDNARGTPHLHFVRSCALCTPVLN